MSKYVLQLEKDAFSFHSLITDLHLELDKIKKAIISKDLNAEQLHFEGLIMARSYMCALSAAHRSLYESDVDDNGKPKDPKTMCPKNITLEERLLFFVNQIKEEINAREQDPEADNVSPLF